MDFNKTRTYHLALLHRIRSTDGKTPGRHTKVKNKTLAEDTFTRESVTGKGGSHVGSGDGRTER